MQDAVGLIGKSIQIKEVNYRIKEFYFVPGTNYLYVGLMKSTTVKPKAFRLDLAQGKIFAILPEEVEIQEPEPKKYSIYGDYEF